jgi:hypothetical protein
MLMTFIISSIFAIITSSFGIPFGISFIFWQLMAIPLYLFGSILFPKPTPRDTTQNHNHTYNDHRLYYDSRSIHITDKNHDQVKKIVTEVLAKSHFCKNLAHKVYFLTCFDKTS